jgi:hypothetical protein
MPYLTSQPLNMLVIVDSFGNMLLFTLQDLLLWLDKANVLL